MTPNANNISAHDLRKLERKMQEGKPLSPDESAAVAAASGHGDRWARNQVQLAAALGVTRQSVVIWRKAGAPAPASDGRYDIAAWREWVAANGRNAKADEKRTGRKSSPAQAKIKATARKLQLQNEKLEAEIGILKRDYLKREDVEAEITQLIIEARKVGELMPAALAPQLAGLDLVQTEIRLRQWWDEFCGALHRGTA